MIQPEDYAHMDRALMHAERGRGLTSPNPMVGAVIVSPDGRVIGAGYHERAGGPHAEIRALSSAHDHVQGATLYCTLEPCCHAGRTGPCVEPIEEAGIARVVAAVEDPNPLVAGGGFAHLREHGVTVDVGVRRRAAVHLNRAFFTFIRKGRPFVIFKAATSADGYMAAGPGVRTRLTSRPALRHAHAVRAEVDAIAVGVGTMLADDPLLTAREVYRARPLVRVVFDRQLRTPPSARLFSTISHGQVIIFTSPDALDRHASRAQALVGAGATLEPSRDTGEAFRRLAALGITSVIVEGGAALHRAVWDAGIVDYVQVYIAPCALGPSGVPLLHESPLSRSALVDARTTVLGPDVLVEGYVHRLD
ncbi:MAG: bifunctional diaminohydroxyphosphoribosylaminopyrimidine deaminase/5-amino-6-(5-phosphoribosylamino)uracil reductase RibD [Bacteroidales bacterium]